MLLLFSLLVLWHARLLRQQIEQYPVRQRGAHVLIRSGERSRPRCEASHASQLPSGCGGLARVCDTRYPAGYTRPG